MLPKIHRFKTILFLAICLLSSPTWANEATDAPFNFSEVISHHLADAPIFPLNFGGQKVYQGTPGYDPEHHAVFLEGDKSYHFLGGIDLHITKRVTMMWIACFFLLVVFIPAANLISKDPTKVHSKFTSTVEVFVTFLKEKVVDESLGHHGHSYYHYIFTVFFFILFCNLLGLIPPIGELAALATGVHLLGEIWSGITVTGDISVTVTLAGLTLLLIYGTAFSYQGIAFVAHAVPKGVPAPLWPLMWILEFFITHLARCFALTMRLLANMTAGHVLLLTLFGFIFMSQSYLIAPVSILSTVAIYFLELLVAFLQAFIFSLLTSVFIGTVMHRH